MPLPFLHPKKAVSVIVAQRGKRDVEIKPEDTNGDPDLIACGEDLLRAIDERSPSGIADALYKAFEKLESEPHEEAEKEE